MALKKDRFYSHEPAAAKQQLSPQQIHETRIVADLRIMHSMVSQLYHHIRDLHDRYTEPDIIGYADQDLLTVDIKRNDETYQFFVALAEQRRKLG
ncbi:MAG: hypothetical protein WBM04_13865 [Candidatus Korobacteraceae bacterium]